MNARNNHSAFVRELLGDEYVDHVRSMLLASVELIEGERYELRSWVDGYEITDRGEVICVFHGPQFDLASKVLRMLKDESARSQKGGAECALRSLASAGAEPSAAGA